MAKCYGIKNGEIVVYSSPRAARADRYFGITCRLGKRDDVMTTLLVRMHDCTKKVGEIDRYIKMGSICPLSRDQENYVRSYLHAAAMLAVVQAEYQVHYIIECGKSPTIVDASTVRRLLDLGRKWNETALTRSRIQQWVSVGDKYHPLGSKEA